MTIFAVIFFPLAFIILVLGMRKATKARERSNDLRQDQFDRDDASASVSQPPADEMGADTPPAETEHTAPHSGQQISHADYVIIVNPRTEDQ